MSVSLTQVHPTVLFVGSNTVAGSQPMHVEAQLTAAISNTTMSYKTIVTPGSCSGELAYRLHEQLRYRQHRHEDRRYFLTISVTIPEPIYELPEIEAIASTATFQPGFDVTA